MAGGRAGEVDDVEVFLAVIDLESRATADDLLELGSGAHDTRQHHVFDHLGINACGQKLRRSQNDGRGFVHVLEVRQMGEPDGTFIGCHTAYVIGVLFDEVVV